MMKITKHFFMVFCYFLLLTCVKVSAQTNLVPNPSFEQYISCPIAFNSPQPIFWYNATNYTFEYYNSCSNPSLWGVPFSANNKNFQYARNGNAYIGMYLINGSGVDQRNYYQTKLQDSLKQDKYYYCEFYVACTNLQKLKCNNISALLSKNPVMVDTNATPYGVLYANAQIFNYGNPIITDTLNWIKVSGIYKALGGEQYLTLGNFKDDAHTSYFASQSTGLDGAGIFIDDVSVIPLDSFCLQADAGRDTTVKINDSVYIGCYTNGIDTIKWFNAAGQIIDSTRPGFWVKPGATGSYMYVVEQTVNGCYSRDTVWVNVVLPLKFTMYNVRCTIAQSNSSPRGNERSVENIWQTADEINVSHYNIQRSTNAKDFTTIGTVKAKNKSYNEYEFIDDSPLTTADSKSVYYRIEAVDKDGTKNYSTTQQINLSTTQLISIFPNPAKDVVNVVSKEPIDKLLVIDYLGREVIQALVNGHKNYQLSIINHPLPKGLYMVQVVLTNGVIENRKLIVE